MKNHKVFILIIIATWCLLSSVSAYCQDAQLVDRIVAVVGDHIILLSDVRLQIRNLMIAKNMDENVPNNVLQSMFREVIQDSPLWPEPQDRDAGLR